MPYLRTTFLLALLTSLFVAAGFLLGGTGGMLIAFGVALVMNLFAYWNADKMVLRMYGAKPVDQARAPEFYGMVEALAQNAQLPMPKVYIVETDQPNAFATGRNPDNAAVAATTGLLKRLNRDEIEAVMAHELAHVRNRDTLIMTITAVIAGAISMIANFGLFFGGGGRNNPLGIVGVIAVAILAPLAAMLVQMAISRTREYQADAGGAEISGKPLALASALEKIERMAKGIDNHSAEANPASAHLFIINPLHAHKVDSLFSTHPSTANRVAKLEEIATIMERGGEISNVMSERPSTDTARPLKGRGSVPRSGGRRGPWS